MWDISAEFIRGITAGIEYMPDDVCYDMGFEFASIISLGFFRIMIYKIIIEDDE